MPKEEETTVREVLQVRYGEIFLKGLNRPTFLRMLVDRVRDAVKAVGVPAVEVHISDPDTREDFRKVSYIRSACIATVAGRGFRGYLDAIDLLRNNLSKM